MYNTMSHIDEVSKVHIHDSHLYMTQIFTCLKFYYISSSIKMLYTLKHSQKRLLLGIFFWQFHATWWQKVVKT